ncbi:hypothetical protein NST54_17655 [Caldifermentibacillus hisashii]|uniref:hypothetical protein n=1 Tax=Caldifermentibacillus hisashii TaxID=996558 RepID=UPI0034D6B56B
MYLGIHYGFSLAVVQKVNPPTEEEVSKIKEGATFVSFLYPAQNGALVKELSQKKAFCDVLIF